MRAIRNRPAGAGTGVAAGGKWFHRGVLEAAVRTVSGENFRIAAANAQRVAASYPSRLLNLAGCVKRAAAAGLHGFSGDMLYNEKEQSTDSAGTDVG